MFATTGALVTLVAVNDAISPEPDSASPIPGAEFTQLKIVDPFADEKLIAVVAPLLHKTWPEIRFT